MASWDGKMRFKSQLSRMSCQTFSMTMSLGAFRRQWDQGDILRHRQLVSYMPAGLIEQQHRVCPWCHRRGDLGKMQGHRGGVAVRQHQGCTLAFLGTDGAEDVGRCRALVFWSGRPGTPRRPAMSDFIFLPNPGFIGEPDLYRGRFDTFFARDRLQHGGEGVLKRPIAPLAWA